MLYGLRRTGKTTIMNQIIDEYKNSLKCAFYEIENKDKMDNIYDMLICERDKGTKLICLDEITNAKDFIENSAILADIFAKEGMKIIITGTESLGFYFAEDKSLFDRIFTIKTTYIPYAEHSEVLGTDDIDDYIKYGGLMREGLNESAIYDYISAKKYLDSSVSDNIISSIHKDWHNNNLKDMEAKELKAIIAKMIEIYSGVFNKTQMQNQLEKVSVNAPLDLLYESKISVITLR